MLTAKEVAPLLGLSQRKVYQLADSGKLKSYRFDDAVRFDPQDVAAYKEASCRSITTKPASVGGMSSAVSLMDSDSALQNFFRRAGPAKKLKPTGRSKTRGSTLLRLAHSASSR